MACPSRVLQISIWEIFKIIAGSYSNVDDKQGVVIIGYFVQIPILTVRTKESNNWYKYSPSTISNQLNKLVGPAWLSASNISQRALGVIPFQTWQNWWPSILGELQRQMYTLMNIL
jgi:hypothetical protein